MKSSKMKILILVALIIITFFSLNSMSVSVTIEGRGRGTLEPGEKGGWLWSCDNATNTSCTLTIHLPEQ